MNLSLITPTGGRQKAFDLCIQWILRQSIFKTKPKIEWEWIIIDDCVPETKIPINPHIKLIHPKEPWLKNTNTQARNLILGLEAAQGSIISIIEDDDWYHKDYLKFNYDLISQTVNLLALGESHARYYNIAFRDYGYLGNRNHACLCQTMFHEEAKPILISTLKNKESTLWHDFNFWRALHRKYDLDRLILFDRSQYVVGMKGLPGRPGIGKGHRRRGPASIVWHHDPGFKQLTKWIGIEDVEVYQETLEIKERTDEKRNSL